MYLDAEFFMHGVFALSIHGYCEKYKALSTNTNFLMTFMFLFSDNGRCFTQAIRETPIDCYSYFLWERHDYCSLFQLKRQFGSPKGLVIYKRYKDEVEFWTFSGINCEKIPKTITHASMEPFLDFMTYFNKHKISNQLLSPFVSYQSPFDMSYIHKNQDQIEKFKNSINANNFTLWSENQSITLSKREKECLSQTAFGKIFKEIAYDLSISPRTVEKHLDNIKHKAGISYKSELVKLFHKNSSVPYF